MSRLRGSSVKGTESLECGSNGRVILDRYFYGCIGCSFAGSGGGCDGYWLGCTGADCSRILVPITSIPTVV